MHAGYKWLQLLFDVVNYEVEEGPLLSEGADDLVEKHPVLGRVFILAVGAVITLHLANVIDERFDLLATSFWKSTT